MRILVVDDKPDQRERAAQAVRDAGHEPVVVEFLADVFNEGILDGVDGIITDFLYNAYDRQWNNHFEYADNPPPCGAALVIAAMHLAIPVAICTDGNHHGVELAWFHDAFISQLGHIVRRRAKADSSYSSEYDERDPNPNFPFGWFERKDWDTAVKFIELRVARLVG